MFLLSGPAHGRISAMPHKGFLEKQQERPVVPKGQYVPAAHRQGGGTNEKRRHTSKAAVRTQTRQQCTGKAAARRQGGDTNEKRRHTSKASSTHAGKAAAHRRSGGHRQNEGRSAAESRKEFRRLGLPVCTAVGFCPAVFCTREPFPCLQFSARIFSSSSCR